MRSVNLVSERARPPGDKRHQITDRRVIEFLFFVVVVSSVIVMLTVVYLVFALMLNAFYRTTRNTMSNEIAEAATAVVAHSNKTMIREFVGSLPPSPLEMFLFRIPCTHHHSADPNITHKATE